MKKMYDGVKTLRTTYRKLENFLYLIGIGYLESGKDWDGSTYWVYEDTPQLRLAVETFKELERKLKALNEHS